MNRRSQSLVVLTISVAAGALLAFFGGRWLEDRTADPQTPVAERPRRNLPSTLIHRPDRNDAADSSAASTARDMSRVVPRVGGCGTPAPFTGAGRLKAGVGLSGTRYPAYIPARYDPNSEHVLLLIFHDDSQDASDFMVTTGFLEIADELGFVVIAPQDKRVMAWPDAADVEVARSVVQGAYDALCIDLSRVYAVGYGAGGRVVEEMPCVMEVAGIATAAFRSTDNDHTCFPTKPVPYIHLAPLKDGYTPIDGGRNCGGLHSPISLPEKERRWRERNGCRGDKRTYITEGKTKCYAWDCGDTPFASCHLDGGRGWPGTRRRLFDIRGCDGTPANFEFAKTIWQFFARGPGTP